MRMKVTDVTVFAGTVLLFAGLVLQFVRHEYAPYIYLAGAVMFAYVQVVVSGYAGKNAVIRRLRRQQILGAMLLVFTGVVMLLWHRNEWIVCLAVSAILELYTAFRIPQEEAKEKESE